MLFAEFAVNPVQVDSIDKLAMLKGSFDFSRGALICTFPNSWVRQVNDQLTDGLNDMQRKRVTSLLTTLRDRALIKSGREYVGDNWHQAARLVSEEKPFFSIVGSDNHAPPQHLSSIELLEHVDFEALGSIDVPRQAADLIRPLAPLLIGAAKIRLVDPYACPTKANVTAVLKALFDVLNGRRCAIEIYSEEAADFDLVKAHFRQLLQHLPENINLSWFWLNDGDTGQLHQRLLFTERGGVIFDRGFIEPNAREQRQVSTNLRTMTKTQVDNATRDYNDTQTLVPRVLRLSSVDTEFRS
ncbi:hypothetical protein [Rheinheimera sp. NSM]|uniref:hypothetical protein n=1 Tax=Rheinheimera sp. NSM TaxID=3457884 RepID=UPI004037421E